MIDNLQVRHLLTDIARLHIVIFSFIYNPLQDFFAGDAAFVDCEPASFEVLHLQLTPHYLCPILQRRLLIHRHLMLLIRLHILYLTCERTRLVNGLVYLLFFEWGRLVDTRGIYVRVQLDQLILQLVFLDEVDNLLSQRGNLD